MWEEVGSPGWARTSDFLINSQALYQLSYRGTIKSYRSFAATRDSAWTLRHRGPTGSREPRAEIFGAPRLTLQHSSPTSASANLITPTGGSRQMKVRPLHDRIMVERLEEQEVKRGGIIIPDTAKEKPQEGKVIAVGTGKGGDDGKKIPLDVEA